MNLDDVLKQASKKFSALRKGHDSDVEFKLMSEEDPVYGLELKNPLMEKLLSRRFFAYGKCSLIYGYKGSSKTSLCFDLIKKYQEAGGITILIESEQALDPDFMEMQGVDNSKLIVAHNNTLEEGFALILAYAETLQDSDVPVLIVFDGLNGVGSDYDMEEEDLDKSKVGDYGKTHTRFYKRIVPLIGPTMISVVCTNQLKDEIGGMQRGPFQAAGESLNGGRAQRFCSVYQLKMAKIQDLHETNEFGKKTKAGSRHSITPTRSKLGDEGSSEKIEIDLYKHGGIDWFTPLVQYLGDDYPNNPIIKSASAGKYKWMVPNTPTKVLKGEEYVEEMIPVDKPLKASALGIMIMNSDLAQEECRTVFKIRPAPTKEEIEEMKKKNKDKRAKRKNRKEEDDL